MDKFDRIFQLHQILAARRTPAPLAVLLERLECSKATFHRLVAHMRDRLGAPIVCDADQGGYRYTRSPEAPVYDLPGLWFSARELQALVVLQNVLKDLGPGLLEEHLSPVARRINELIAHERLNLSEAATRVRVLAIAARRVGFCFQIVASATLQRRKLRISYQSRSKDEPTERVLSPQRLAHYRDNWYLDAWDELRSALRIFAVDRIASATELEETAMNVPALDLKEHYESAYGIFSGKANKTAVLRFSQQRARWVADEHWHPEQSGQFLTDGTYEIRIPYRDPRELVMDVLRHGFEVEVIAPESLRTEVATALKRAAALYAT